MTTTLNYRLRDFYTLIPKGAMDIYIMYILHGNERNRAWPTITTLSKLSGWGKTKVSEFKKWWVEHGALEAVPFDKRVGKETEAYKSADVMQITGIVVIEGHTYHMLYNSSPGETLESQDKLANIPPGNILQGGHKSILNESESSPTDSTQSPLPGLATGENSEEESAAGKGKAKDSTSDNPPGKPTPSPSPTPKPPRQPTPREQLWEAVAAACFKITYIRGKTKLAKSVSGRINGVTKDLFESDATAEEFLKAVDWWKTEKQCAVPRERSKVCTMVLEYRTAQTSDEKKKGFGSWDVTP